MRDINAVEQAILAAPLEENGWDMALRAMANATGSTFGQLISFGYREALTVNHISDMPADMLKAFEDAPESYSQENWRIASTAAALQVVTEDDYDRARIRCATDWYDEACDRMQIPFGMQTALLTDRDTIVGMAALRTRSDGRSGADARETFSRLLPFALSGVRLHHVLAGRAAQAIVDGFTAAGESVFVLDRHGRVCSHASGGEETLRGRLLCLRNGKLRAGSAPDQAPFAKALAEMLRAADLGQAAGRSLWLGKHLGPMQARRCEILPLPQRVIDYVGHWPRLLVRLLEPRPFAGRDRDMLGEILGLTPAEADVALLVMQGTPREAIARHRGTSVGTVTIQLKRIFEKAEVGREAELVSHLHRLLG